MAKVKNIDFTICFATTVLTVMCLKNISESCDTLTAAICAISFVII